MKAVSAKHKISETTYYAWMHKYGRMDETQAKQLTSSPLFGGEPAIVTMWRFTKNNGITEGFHRKMKLIQRRAYGFKNFHNYRLRVIAQCG